MDIISAILFLSSLVAGIALLEENRKALQLFYAINLILMTSGIFLNIATDSPKQFADVFLTKDYAIMIPIAINAQLLAMNYTPTEVGGFWEHHRRMIEYLTNR